MRGPASRILLVLLLLLLLACTTRSASHFQPSSIATPHERLKLHRYAANITLFPDPRSAPPAIVYLRRTRKSGSTSISRLLMELTKSLRAANEGVSTSEHLRPTLNRTGYFGMEYAALKWRCLIDTSTDRPVALREASTGSLVEHSRGWWRTTAVRSATRAEELWAPASTLPRVVRDWYFQAWRQRLEPPTALALAPRAKVLSVTHLREPVSRHNSEFWYQGPGRTRTRKGDKGDARMRGDSEALWRGWMSDGYVWDKSSMGAGFNAGHYFSNYFTREYTYRSINVTHGREHFATQRGTPSLPHPLPPSLPANPEQAS